ncbi:MAG TPA: hypothetical protein DIU15_00365 [Deltaproteobacteria bacterium]|nr:hypothetical protein [Deltaproteobacteria bacterium]HCP44481.1 hypothetical protein [Deltaproteobacteria bacterium]
MTRRELQVLLFLLAGMPGVLGAQEPPPEDLSQALAVEAHQVLMDHCAQAAGEATTKAAESVVLVSDVWARVSAQLEASQEPYLLYWRGVLAQCLDQEDRALQDLVAFSEAPADSNLFMELVRDARRRTRRLRAAQRSADGKQVPAALGLGLGLSLGGGSALALGLAGWQWTEAVQRRDQLTQQVHSGTEIDDVRSQMETHEETSRALIVLGTTLGTASAVMFIVTAASQQGPPKSRTAVLRAVPMVSPAGVGVMWSGRW